MNWKKVITVAGRRRTVVVVRCGGKFGCKMNGVLILFYERKQYFVPLVRCVGRQESVSDGREQFSPTNAGVGSVHRFAAV